MLPLANLIALALAALALADATGRLGRARGDRPSALAGWTIAALVIGMWLLSSGLAETSTLRYLGTAFLALTLGYCPALLLASVPVALSAPPEALGLAWLGEALVPVWSICLLVAACRRRLPRDPFAFMLGCGFFGLFAVYALQLLIGVGVQELVGGGGESLPPPSERIVWGLLLAAGEATLEGMLVTVLVVCAPWAVRLYDERFYLGETRPPEA